MVIAIIAILGALLLPSLKGARDRAKGVVCASNLKQLYLAHLTYAKDYNDAFISTVWNPGGSVNNGAWTTALLSLGYLPQNSANARGAVLDCPMNNHFGPGLSTCGDYAMNTAAASDIYNKDNAGVPTIRELHYLGWFADPARTVLLQDAQRGNAPTGNAYAASPFYMQPMYHYDPTWYCLYHNNGINLAMVDGHVEWRAEKNVNPYSATGLGW